MTALTVAKDALAAVGLSLPSTIFGSTDEAEYRYQGLLNECARRIAEERAWQRFTTLHTITGDGATTEWSLPSDFDFVTDKITRLWCTAFEGPLHRVKSPDQWRELVTRDIQFTYPAFIFLGDALHTRPALDSGSTTTFYYQSNKIVSAEDETTKAAFTADADTFRLPERLLRLCFIWQYKEDKGMPFEKDEASYFAALDKAATRDGVFNQGIVVGGGNSVAYEGYPTAYPWNLSDS